MENINIGQIKAQIVAMINDIENNQMTQKSLNSDGVAFCHGKISSLRELLKRLDTNLINLID